MSIPTGVTVRAVDVDDPFIEGKIGKVLRYSEFRERPGYDVSFEGIEVWLAEECVRPTRDLDEYDNPKPMFNPGDKVYIMDWLFEEPLYGEVVYRYWQDGANEWRYCIDFEYDIRRENIRQCELFFQPKVTDEFKELIGA